ncbi:MAG: radical SAM protein [Candidatus ainarchaeum sp.]|nr:radical SAM protein [Candidatus ainarchaeum sp.]
MLPEKIPFEVTLRCNCRCEMCRYHADDSPKHDFSEMSLDEIKLALTKINNYYRNNGKQLKIGLTGGEPLLRKDIDKIILIFKELSIPYDIVTNLSLANEKIINLFKDYPPYAINVSIDGVGEVHNKIRRANIFEIVKLNLIAIKENLPSIPIQIDCTITNNNVGNLLDMAKFASDLKINLNIRHLTFITKNLLKLQQDFELKHFNKIFNHDFNLYSLNRENVIILKKEISKIKEFALKQNNSKITFFPNLDKNLDNWYLNEEKQLSSSVCDPYKIRIKPNGDIVHCENYVYGNILNQDFDEILNSENTKKIVNIFSNNFMPFCNRCSVSFINYSEK